MAERTCSIDGCGSAHYGRGWCRAHWKRWRRWGDPTHVPLRTVGVAPCSVDDCEKLVTARGLCTAHYTRLVRHGSPTARRRGEVVDGKRICPLCGEDKSLTEWGQAACRPCDAARWREWAKANPRERSKSAAVCDYCGVAFLGDRRRWRYCTRECFQANKNRANWKHLNARRARLRDAHEETFDRLEIFTRDAWVCQICCDPVDPLVRWPDPLSASLDHIIPIARGGKHSRANAQCAHLDCNVRKGVTIS